MVDPSPAPVAAGLAPLAALLDPPLMVVDAGCRWAATSSWALFRPRVQVVGFDADAQECARLAAEHAGDPGLRFVPLALAEASGSRLLHVAREPACSSFFPPDPTALRERPELSLIEERGTLAVQATSLDEWAAAEGVARVDALKLDTQGAELAILRGAERALAGVRALDLEVSFNPMYAGQALFSDVDAFLRERGFALWRLGHLVHYGRDGGADRYAARDVQFFDGRQVDFDSYGGQLYWGQAYYVAREIAFREAPVAWRDRVRDACVCAGLGFGDLVEWSLERALEDAPAEAAGPIRGALAR